jgi:hypothetical protein
MINSNNKCIDTFPALAGIEKKDTKTGTDLGLNCIGLVNEARGYKATNETFIIDQNNLNFLIPGDLVVWYYDSGGISHIMIIESISYDGNSRNVNTSNIKVIHQTTWNENWYVQKSYPNPTRSTFNQIIAELIAHGQPTYKRNK